MLPIIISPYIVGFAGLTYLVPALALTLYYNYICLSLYKFKKDKFDIKIARQVFTKIGPLAFLPISDKETSIVYSIRNLSLIHI